MSTAALPPVNTAYTVKADDFTGSVYRPNSILQSINARISALEDEVKNTTQATGRSTATQVNINSGYFVDTIAANAISPDLVNAFTHEVVLNQGAQITINTPIYTGKSINPGQDFIMVIVQDATGNRPLPAWGAGFTGTAGISLAPDPSTYTVAWFKVRADNKFALLLTNTGVPR
jgi:hypothetical protein